MAPPQDDAGEGHFWHGYPDECYSFTTFADSLVALAWGHGWYMQPPIVNLRNAIVVDFASDTEEEAEASIAGGWNGAWEFPMGTATTVAAVSDVNSQNIRIARQMAFIGTAMRQDEFHGAVIEPLLDEHTCPDRPCTICAKRPHRGLAQAFEQLASGTEQCGIQLFSRWKPSPKLRAFLRSNGVRINHHSVSLIPQEDFEANRSYHIWTGTPLQAEQFRKTVWAPAWRKKSKQ